MFHKIKWFIQRGTRGYADCDVWDLDSYICTWLPKALRQLRDTGCGYPMEETAKKWKDILTQMADGFEAHNLSLELPDNKEFKKQNTKLKNGLKLFTKYFNCLWD